MPANFFIPINLPLVFSFIVHNIRGNMHDSFNEIDFFVER
ncbi:hypothetical protein HMPREF9372_2285 [Sporosarcina newyorkensis 2681]|uniref:Uncharacterized protein n=1 Tax=Sporosarcina newyorkensis 2681 TaxID=1027292 RepID=F9DU04_9BACL|nr:hypothetical protein HMPREF9372_2285 [Sporosarcina newyorkensis 2681]